jgi:prolipoprotein diacylglyceryltransferase
MSYVVLYAILRVFVSFLRLDTEVFMGLRTAQLIAIVTAPLGLAALIYLLRSPPATGPRRFGWRRALPDETPVPPPPSEEPSAG